MNELKISEKKLAAIAAAAAGAYSLGLNPMPAIRRLADAGNCPRIHYFAGHMPSEAVAGDYALQRHESGGKIQVEITILEDAAGRPCIDGPDGLIGGDIAAATDWMQII